MNSLLRGKLRKVITEEYKCKSGYWMNTEYDEAVLEDWRLPNEEFIVTLKQDEELECD